MKVYLFGYMRNTGKCWNAAKRTYRGRMEHCLYMHVYSEKCWPFRTNWMRSTKDMSI